MKDNHKGIAPTHGPTIPKKTIHSGAKIMGNINNEFCLYVESDQLGSHGEEARDTAEIAMTNALRALSDGGQAACAVMEFIASAKGNMLESVRDIGTGGCRLPTQAEVKAYRDWGECEKIAEYAAYEGWYQRPDIGGLFFHVMRRSCGER